MQPILRLTSREYQRKWRENNPEKNREYQRLWRLHHPEINKIRKREYQRKYRKEHPESDIKYRKNNPKKIKARNILSRKHLPLGSECEFCGRTEKLEHGHLDYNYPEIYLTVCHECNCWMEVD